MKREIVNLLGILFGAILCGAAAAFYFIYYYGGTGQYKLENILVSPETLQKLAYQEFNPQSKRSSRYVFKEIDFIYNGSQQRKIGPETYKKLYDLLKDDRSLSQPSAEIERLFFSQAPARLIIKVKQEGAGDLQEALLPFQEVQFAEGTPYYRVQLRVQEGTSSAWTYFDHPDAYLKVMSILT